jgi:processive 1,2-diacylglycerol beta-glucosyltransferase
MSAGNWFAFIDQSRHVHEKGTPTGTRPLKKLANLPRDHTQAAVLTASFGDGHLSAAKGIVSALHRSGVNAPLPLDLLKAAKPDTVDFLNAAYRTVITRWPWLWRKLYQLADSVPVGEVPIDFTGAVTRRIAAYLNQSRPATVISTYPLYAHLIGQLFGNRPLPFGLITVVTDSTTINRAWLSNTQGHYAVTDRDSAEFFLGSGIPEDRVHVTGFPVDPCFAMQEDSAGKPNDFSPLRILYTPSTRNELVRKNLQALRELTDRHKIPLHLTMVLGRHEQRLHQVVESCAPENTRIIGWTDNMPALLSSHHLLIGKAGGASVHEALAAGCPMLVDYVVPGQEEGNAIKLVRLKAGIIARSSEELTDGILALMENSAQNLQAMRMASLENAHPDAGVKIAALAVQIANGKDIS